ncbi:MAG TPA: AMP-binding protein [Abditibacteriaceae bacterium]|jgi:acyl-CoA synthetase (AMP-forming)/AMP-acid ligase II
MNIVEVLRAQACHRPNEIAIRDTFQGHKRDWSFAQLEDASARTASLLRSKGLKAGDHTLVFVPMSAELYIALTAVFRLGLVATFLDPSAGRDHISDCCNRVMPQAFIGIARAHLLRLVSPALRRIPHHFCTDLPIPAANPLQRAMRLEPDSEITPCDAQTPALLTFTSGSTGGAKALVRTHGFLLQQHRVLEKNLKLQAGDSELSTLPIFVLANLASGVTSIIPDADLRRPGSIDAAKIIPQINLHSPTRAAASPAFFERVCDYCEKHKVTLPSLKAVYTGGAPVLPGLMHRLQNVAPQAEIVAVYGSTEAEPIAHLSLEEIALEDHVAMRNGKGLLAGVPVAEIQLHIMPDRWGTQSGPFTKEEFNGLSMPVNATGEIVVSGAHVVQGYLHGQHEEETKFHVDDTVWHRTGDAGYLDERGRLWLVGRCAARLQDAGGIIYPFQVECAAQEFAFVRRAAFVSHRSKRVLVVEPVMTRAKINCTELKETLSWARIDRVVVVKSLPMDKRHNAKIEYSALAKLLDARSKGLS